MPSIGGRSTGRAARTIRSWGRALCLFLLAAVAVVCGCSLFYYHLGGAFVGTPSDMEAHLNPGARRLIEEAFSGIGAAPVADFHVHVFTKDIHPDLLSFRHPIKRARTMVYMSASGVRWGPEIERDYADRLLELTRSFPAPTRFFILAFDKRYRLDGTADEEGTPFYVSNEYVYELARSHPDVFVPVISVHPYRPDAAAELTKWARAGCRYVKWLPPVMGMDPASEKALPFYRIMREHGMILLSHTGEERAVDVEPKASRELGNPLLLKAPLEMGVRVVALHSASRGSFADLESSAGEEAHGFDLLFRMLENPRYDGLLFGEISAMTFYNHLDRPLRALLAREDLHRRFINGSDYPLPGINCLIRTSSLASWGFITEQERSYLNEIYGYNPLLFDFVVKRTVRDPQTGRRLSPSIFTVPRALASTCR